MKLKSSKPPAPPRPSDTAQERLAADVDAKYDNLCVLHHQRILLENLIAAKETEYTNARDLYRRKTGGMS